MQYITFSLKYLRCLGLGCLDPESDSHITADVFAVMLYTDVLDKLSNDLGKDLYILPSSVHELIVVPFDENISGSDLAMIVKDINEKGVAAEDILSDNVYEFRRSDKKIHM